MNRTTRRRAQIDIETREVIVVRNTGERPAFVCVQCGQDFAAETADCSNSTPGGLEGENNANYGNPSDIKLVTVNP